jgi:hypothetical protein
VKCEGRECQQTQNPELRTQNLMEDFEYKPGTSQKTAFLNILSTFEQIIWILQYQ